MGSPVTGCVNPRRAACSHGRRRPGRAARPQPAGWASNNGRRGKPGDRWQRNALAPGGYGRSRAGTKPGDGTGEDERSWRVVVVTAWRPPCTTAIFTGVIGSARGGVDGAVVGLQFAVDHREVLPLNRPSSQLSDKAVAGFPCACTTISPSPLVETLDDARRSSSGPTADISGKGRRAVAPACPAGSRHRVDHQARRFVHDHEVFVGKNNGSHQRGPSVVGAATGGPVQAPAARRVHLEELATSEPPATGPHDASRDAHTALVDQARGLSPAEPSQQSDARSMRSASSAAGTASFSCSPVAATPSLVRRRLLWPEKTMPSSLPLSRLR